MPHINPDPMRIVAFLILLFLVNVGLSQPRGNAKRMEERILKLGTFGANPQGGVSRVAYSEADLAGRAYVMNLLKAAGLEVSVDAAGNIIGKRKGTDPNLPAIAFGSHIDSVPGGGNYDGDVGSLGAIECIELMNENKITTRHPLEVIIFQNEEGGLIGSEALCGILQPATLDLVTHSGKTIRQGIADIGGNVAQLATAAKQKGYYHSFLELHIEQGGILDQKKINIGFVEGIVGINQW
jgi:N-carbamoyl-L-amino-acid hydrolase